MARVQAEREEARMRPFLPTQTLRRNAGQVLVYQAAKQAPVYRRWRDMLPTHSPWGCWEAFWNDTKGIGGTQARERLS